MTNDADAQILNIRDLYVKRQPAQEPANSEFCGARQSVEAARHEGIGRVVVYNNMQVARVLERLLKEWRIAQLDEYSGLCGGATTRLAARIVQIYSSHPDCIKYIAGRSGELLYLVDALYEDYCQRQEETK